MWCLYTGRTAARTVLTLLPSFISVCVYLFKGRTATRTVLPSFISVCDVYLCKGRTAARAVLPSFISVCDVYLLKCRTAIRAVLPSFVSVCDVCLFKGRTAARDVQHSSISVRDIKVKSKHIHQVAWKCRLCANWNTSICKPHIVSISIFMPQKCLFASNLSSLKYTYID